MNCDAELRVRFAQALNCQNTSPPVPKARPTESTDVRSIPRGIKTSAIAANNTPPPKYDTKLSSFILRQAFLNTTFEETKAPAGMDKPAIHASTRVHALDSAVIALYACLDCSNLRP
ncbi:hypothetical protein [Halomonas kalidii]|uniref:Uncharacterized protein n=1 Tax=Halomonas kalidii TaxID=3043293 RepID=A0ABT6VL72_9GAMM|nr:hypothetical protein [Halomonas kalidii]MDI5933531.1 hypothetical protein [Halomonas kalidii]